MPDEAVERSSWMLVSTCNLRGCEFAADSPSAACCWSERDLLFVAHKEFHSFIRFSRTSLSDSASAVEVYKFKKKSYKVFNQRFFRCTTCSLLSVKASACRCISADSPVIFTGSVFYGVASHGGLSVLHLRMAFPNRCSLKPSFSEISFDN